MKPLVLAFALHLVAFDNGASLGVGLDALPEAYSFAASRSGFAPRLRLTICDRTSCRWTTGHGVDLVAYVSEWDLGIKRLEVDATEAAGPGEANTLWFEGACRSLVALTLSGADPSEIKAISSSISSLPRSNNERRERDAAGIRFYGTSTATAKPEHVRQRCGAAVRAR